jgi:hypothetical protein
MFYTGFYEKWYYGKTPSIIGSLIPFYPFGIRSESFIAYFDKNEKVVAFSSPVIKEDLKLGQPNMLLVGTRLARTRRSRSVGPTYTYKGNKDHVETDSSGRFGGYLF